MEDTTQHPADGYPLNPKERYVLALLNQNALHIKALICDLTTQLDEARKELSGIEKSYSGAVTLIAQTHGMSTVKISPDLTRVMPSDN